MCFKEKGGIVMNSRRTPGRTVMYIFLAVVLVFMLVPFLWLLVSSFRPNADLFNEPFAVPKHLSTLASYAMLYRFSSRKILTVLFSMCLFIPTNAFLVPYYVMINKIGLYDNILGIALVYAGVNLPMSLMVIRGYMETIPGELLESAKIDGATAGQAFRRIILPVSKPGIVTACVFIVINSWNELLFANLLNQSDSSRTIQVAIRSFLTTFEANYAYAFAAMVISILPTIVIYAMLTDKIIGGMTAGAVKG